MFNRISNQKHADISLQAASTLFKKTPLPLHEGLLRRGAVCANAHLYAPISILFWCVMALDQQKQVHATKNCLVQLYTV